MSEKKNHVTTFVKVFWAFMLVSLALSIGSGPLPLDIARISIVGMVAIYYIATRVYSKFLLINGEGLCLAIMITAGVITNNGYLIAIGIAMSCFWGLIILHFYLRKRLSSSRT